MGVPKMKKGKWIEIKQNNVELIDSYLEDYETEAHSFPNLCSIDILEIIEVLTSKISCDI